MVYVFIFARLSYIIGMLLFWVAFASMGARKITIKETEEIFLIAIIAIIFLTITFILDNY